MRNSRVNSGAMNSAPTQSGLFAQWISPITNTSWLRSEGVGLGESDTKEGVAAFLLRNPGLSAVAESLHGEIVGAVLCGHDGRRGYLHHLAVAATHRRRGIARRLVQYSFSGLANEKIPKCNIFVFRENPGVVAFWTHNGWSAPTWQIMQRRVDT
jgi:ribosomal protein S18 acetylase RimI-like enzyme